MKKAEIILAALVLISLVLYVVPVSGAELGLLSGTGMLAMIYCYLGFALFNGIPFRKIFKGASYQGIKTERILGGIAVGFALSTLVLGLLFNILAWMGGSVMLLAGWAGFAIVALIALFKYLRKKDPFYKGLLIRFAIYSLASSIVLLLPELALQELKYRDHPDYLNAWKASRANPQDEGLKQKVAYEREKMWGRE